MPYLLWVSIIYGSFGAETMGNGTFRRSGRHAIITSKVVLQKDETETHKHIQTHCIYTCGGEVVSSEII